MLEHLRSTDSLIWTIARQSSAFLALDLAASFALRKRPARAHWVLLGAMLAALISPGLTETGRRLGWGLWASRSSAVGGCRGAGARSMNRQSAAGSRRWRGV